MTNNFSAAFHLKKSLSAAHSKERGKAEPIFYKGVKAEVNIFLLLIFFLTGVSWKAQQCVNTKHPRSLDCALCARPLKDGV